MCAVEWLKVQLEWQKGQSLDNRGGGQKGIDTSNNVAALVQGLNDNFEIAHEHLQLQHRQQFSEQQQLHENSTQQAQTQSQA